MAQAVSEFQELLGELAAEMTATIGRLVSSVARLEQSEILAFITDAGPELLMPFLTAAGDLTAVWYDDQDPASDFTATPADLPSLDDLAATARWAMLQADPAVAWSGAATKSLFDASRQTVVTNAEQEGVKWARHAQPNACGFCRMLAVRGFYYRSQEAAMAVRHSDSQGHDHCNCTAVPERGSSYQPPSYLEQWKRDYEAARKSAGAKPGSIANAMDYLPGGRRYKGDAAPPHEPRPRPVNLDDPKPAPKPKPKADAAVQPTESETQIARRLLPGLEDSLKNLRAQGLPESSPQIQYHLTQIARWKKVLLASK